MYLQRKAQAKTKGLGKKAQAKKAQAALAKDSHGAPVPVASNIVPTGLIVRLRAPADAVLTLATERGNVAVSLAELASGAARRYLDNRVEVRLVPSAAALVTGPREQDFPAAVSDGKSGAWITYVEHAHRGPEVMTAYADRPDSFKDLVPRDGGDQVKLVHFNGRTRAAALDVTPSGLDVWRPASRSTPGAASSSPGPSSVMATGTFIPAPSTPRQPRGPNPRD